MLRRWALAVLLLPCSARAASTDTPRNDVPLDMKTLYRKMAVEVDQRVADGDYLGALDAAAPYVAGQRDADLASFLLDVQSAYLGAVGDDEGARVSMLRAQHIGGRASPPRVYDTAAWKAARRQVRWEEPVEVVRRAAAAHSVIMFSEAHHVPETRAFGSRMLPLLRGLGFEYLALETLKYPVPENPARVAVSTAADAAAGYYFMDPQLADLVRTARTLGFKLVAYEDETTDGGDREEIQARNLYERVLRAKPDAKVVVWAGYGHVYKRTSKSMGKAMAQWLWELTGREPFCLFQVADALDPYFSDAPFYKPLVLDDAKRPRRALVLRNQPGLYPALDAIEDNGVERDAAGAPIVDGYVVHPPFEPGDRRPDWLAREGWRRVAGSLPAAPAQRLLVQAFPAAEGTSAAPEDQVVVGASGCFELWLPDGDHLLRVRDAKGKILLDTRATIGPKSAGSLTLLPPR